MANNKPYKVAVIMQYTEVVYFNAEGEEVARDRRSDDHSYDEGPQESLSLDEIDDYFPTMED